jgi:uncharacterized protein YigE (DUF2233 family)
MSDINAIFPPLRPMAPVEPSLPVQASPGLDAFARHAGPDVSYGAAARYAVFSVDPETHEVRIAIVDEAGRLVRSIPADSVRLMLDSMQRYRAGR